MGKSKQKSNSGNGVARTKYFGDEVITLLPGSVFRDGMSIAEFLRGGGKLSQVRAAIKAERIKVEVPATQ